MPVWLYLTVHETSARCRSVAGPPAAACRYPRPVTTSPGQRPVWVEDPAGLRFIRRDLLAATAGIVAVFLAVAIGLDRGNLTLDAILLVLTVAELALAVGLSLGGHPIPGSSQIRIVLATTPPVFLVLAMAGWATGGPGGQAGYFAAVPAMTAGLLATLIALTQRTRVLLPWVILSCLALLIGGAIGGGLSGAVLVPPICLVGQVVLVGLIRDGIERHHAERRLLVHGMAGLVPLASPQATAAAIVDQLRRQHEPSQSIHLLRFTGLGESELIASSRPLAGTSLRPGQRLPASRNELLRARAGEGPWLARWTVRPEDGAYGSDLAEAGVQALAYVPIVHENRTRGLLVVVDSRAGEESLASLEERLPALIEVGELSGALLGPGFDELDANALAAERLDRILASKSFSPVFQPICELATGRIVGLEALTRFDDATPDEVFEQAGQLGRLQELEIATLSAALAAAERLPSNRWLSVNVSPALLSDTLSLNRILGDSLRPIVLELSEHEAVADYHALTSTMNALVPWISLAIDDAGAGFASLRHILETSPAWVKLDIGVVRGVDADPARQALVAGLVHFARQAGIILIAEGIETETERTMLETLGVELGQGFLLARPAPIDDALLDALARSDRETGAA
jgi:EAL domain-containing protein (putative c-di-GMP-specific phosphodiesterase class I)